MLPKTKFKKRPQGLGLCEKMVMFVVDLLTKERRAENAFFARQKGALSHGRHNNYNLLRVPQKQVFKPHVISQTVILLLRSGGPAAHTTRPYMVLAS